MNILGTIFAALLNSLWQSAAVALLVWIAFRFLPRLNIHINAATRCAVWWAVLAAVVLLPFAPDHTVAKAREATAPSSAQSTPIVAQATPIPAVASPVTTP